MIKILIGGSPCTHWSIAQKNGRETKAEGIGWELFRNYLIAKEKFKPDFFLYENNKSASKAIKDQVATELGVGVDPAVRFTYINSKLVSAQNRERFYVTNFGDIVLPEDRGLVLMDILESGVNRIPEYGDDYTRPIYIGAVPENNGTYLNGKQPSQQYRIYDTNGKAVAVTTAAITNVAEQVKHNEPRQVGALPRPNGELSTSQSMRIYAQDGKSITQSAGGGGLGGKTGLYAIPVEFEGGVPTKAVSCADGKTYTVYKVENGIIVIKGKGYPIKLKDGYYIIRKLTVTECARLQTMPDDFCKVVSNTAAYRALGNGWTAEIIIHLLNHALKDVPRDEEIVVLSMYDGIGTGRYCLDKMGFTNVTYHAYEIDKYPIMVAMDNYPDIIQHGDAFAVREDGWSIWEDGNDGCGN